MRIAVVISSLGLSVSFLTTLTGCAPAPTQAAPQNPRVSVMKPTSRALSDHEQFNGWLEAEHTVEVRARVRGHIHKVHFTNGQFVEQDQMLFELDPRPFETAVGRTEDSLKVFEAQKVAASKEEARLTELLKKGGASQSQVDKAVADTLSLEAQVAGAMNEIERAKLDLEYSRVVAPIAGRVGRAMLSQGNLVNAGGSDPLLTTIVSIDPIRLYFNVDERSLQRYAKTLGIADRTLTNVLAGLADSEAEIQFALDGEVDFSHRGNIAFGDNRIDPATGTLQVYSLVENAGGKFVPGARVRVRLPIGEKYPAMLVPETAILADQDKRYVLIVDDKGMALRRDVTLGKLTDDGMRAIQPAIALEEGEQPADWRVIVDNLQQARINYPVDTQETGEAPAEEPA